MDNTDKNKRLLMLVGVFLCFCMILLAGCLNPESKYEERAIAYINEKYDQEFTPVAEEPAEFIKYGNLTCRTAEMGKGEFARIWVGEENNTFHDNYFGFLIRDEVESYIRGIVTQEFPECKVYYDAEDKPFPDDLTQGNTMEDLYAEDNSIRMTITVYAKADGATEQQYADKTAKIEQKILETGHPYYFRVFVIDENYYSTIDRYSQDDFWDESYKKEKTGEKTCLYEYEGLFHDGEVM